MTRTATTNPMTSNGKNNEGSREQASAAGACGTVGGSNSTIIEATAASEPVAAGTQGEERDSRSDGDGDGDEGCNRNDFVIRDGFPALRLPGGNGRPWIDGDEPIVSTARRGSYAMKAFRRGPRNFPMFAAQTAPSWSPCRIRRQRGRLLFLTRAIYLFVLLLRLLPFFVASRGSRSGRRRRARSSSATTWMC